MFASKALATQLKHGCVVKDPIQRTQQRGIFVEILTPKRQILVAGKNHIVVLRNAEDSRYQRMIQKYEKEQRELTTAVEEAKVELQSALPQQPTYLYKKTALYRKST